jgi:hypothetical protein
MDELQRRFHDSASVMRGIARRIQEAARASRDVDSQIRQAGGGLSDEVGGPPAKGLCFSYLEYLEFSGPSEFERFRGAAPVDGRDIQAVDWEALSRRLLEPPSAG